MSASSIYHREPMEWLRSAASERTALVISDDGELAVALRERLDRAYLTLRDVRPGELPGALDASWWPWMVIGAVDSPLPDLQGALGDAPILISWWGQPPPGIACRTRATNSFTDLVGVVEAALGNRVGGMRLAIGSGVDLPGGSHSESPELQALVSAHPVPFDMPLGRFAGAARALTRAGVPCRPVAGPGGVVLAEPAAKALTVGTQALR